MHRYLVLNRKDINMKKLVITCEDGLTKVFVDDKDISNEIESINFSSVAGDIPTVCLGYKVWTDNCSPELMKQQ